MIKTAKNLLQARSTVVNVLEVQEESVEHAWPLEPRTVLNRVDGNLAIRVRKRLGIEDESAPVYIEETTYYGGYSEYTQENSTSFTVHCAGVAVEVTNDHDETEWNYLANNATVFARLQIWLQVGENPSKLWKDSVFFEEEQLTETVKVPRWTVVRDSMLALVMAEYRVSQLSFCRVSDGNWGYFEKFNKTSYPTYKSLRVSSELSIDKLSTKRAILEALVASRCVKVSTTDPDVAKFIDQAEAKRLA